MIVRIKYVVYRFKFSHYKIKYHLQKTVLNPGKYTRPNVVPAREKKAKSKSQHSFTKMGTTGLKRNLSRTRKKQSADYI